MAYTNSSMVAYTKLSPNHSGQRTHSIDRITPHCVVGQCTAEGLGDWFAKSSTQASSNYGIDKDGRVGMYVEEKNRSWCSSSNANDQMPMTRGRSPSSARPIPRSRMRSATSYIRRSSSYAWISASVTERRNSCGSEIRIRRSPMSRNPARWC